MIFNEKSSVVACAIKYLLIFFLWLTGNPFQGYAKVCHMELQHPIIEELNRTAKQRNERNLKQVQQLAPKLMSPNPDPAVLETLFSWMVPFEYFATQHYSHSHRFLVNMETGEVSETFIEIKGKLQGLQGLYQRMQHTSFQKEVATFVTYMERERVAVAMAKRGYENFEQERFAEARSCFKIAADLLPLKREWPLMEIATYCESLQLPECSKRLLDFGQGLSIQEQHHFAGKYRHKYPEVHAVFVFTLRHSWQQLPESVLQELFKPYKLDKLSKKEILHRVLVDTWWNSDRQSFLVYPPSYSMLFEYKKTYEPSLIPRGDYQMLWNAWKLYASQVAMTRQDFFRSAQVLPHLAELNGFLVSNFDYFFANMLLLDVFHAQNILLRQQKHPHFPMKRPDHKYAEIVSNYPLELALWFDVSGKDLTQYIQPYFGKPTQECRRFFQKIIAEAPHLRHSGKQWNIQKQEVTRLESKYRKVCIAQGSEVSPSVKKSQKAIFDTSALFEHLDPKVPIPQSLEGANQPLKDLRGKTHLLEPLMIKEEVQEVLRGYRYRYLYHLLIPGFTIKQLQQPLSKSLAPGHCDLDRVTTDIYYQNLSEAEQSTQRFKHSPNQVTQAYCLFNQARILAAQQEHQRSSNILDQLLEALKKFPHHRASLDLEIRVLPFAIERQHRNLASWILNRRNKFKAADQSEQALWGYFGEMKGWEMLNIYRKEPVADSMKVLLEQYESAENHLTSRAIYWWIQLGKYYLKSHDLNDAMKAFEKARTLAELKVMDGVSYRYEAYLGIAEVMLAGWIENSNSPSEAELQYLKNLLFSLNDERNGMNLFLSAPHISKRASQILKEASQL